MPFITSVERLGIKRGQVQTAREAVIEILEERFGSVPEGIVQAIDAIDNIPRLKALHRRTVSVPSLVEFQREL